MDRVRMRQFVSRRLRVVLALLALGTLASFAGWLGWAFDLAAHFRVQWALAAGVLVGAGALVRDWVACGIATVVLAANAAAILPFYWGPARPPDLGRTVRLRVVIANVLTSNQSFRSLRELVRAERPDLVLLQETNAAWLAALRELQEAYPHQVLRPRPDNFGIALFSRLPLLDSSIHYFGTAGVPTIEARVRHGGRALRILLTHPMPPMRPRHAQLRDEQLAAVATFVRTSEVSTILAGDFNTTPWAASFHGLMRRSGLVNSARGFGLQPTWPATLPWPFRIAIDHCLHTRDLVVLDRRVGPAIGSDHMPLVVDFAFGGG